MPDTDNGNIFRRTPTVTIADRNLRDARYKTRYNAYVKITSDAGGTLPQPGTSFDDTYSGGKPSVVLNSVTIHEGQEFGSLLQAEVQFTCFTKSKFDELSKQFLLLRKNGGKEPVKVDIEFGLVGSPFSNADGRVKDLIIYNFGYQLTADNAYQCTFKAMGSAELATHISISATNRIPELGLTFKDASESSDPIPVITVPDLLKSLAQSFGSQRTIDLQPALSALSTPVEGHILIANHPCNWNPDSQIGNTIYGILQSLGLAGGDDTSKLIYCTLEWLINVINKLIKPKEGEMANITFICNKTVTSGAYLPSICSSNPLNILMVGGDIGNYFDPSKSADENLITSTIPGVAALNPYTGRTYDYSKIFLSHGYLSTKGWGQVANTENVEEPAADPNDKPAETGFAVGDLLKQIFDDISTYTGGAVKLMTIADPKDRTRLLIVPTNEDTPESLRPVRFDPLNGDGITRDCVISCNPASEDAYAIASGPASTQSSTVEATGGAPTPTPSLADIRKKISTAKTDLARDEFLSARTSALTDLLVQLTTACGPKEITEGQIPVTSAMWPLKLDITLDGIYGFRFGDCIETTFLPDVYLQGGIHAGFIVQRVVHTISNNEWTTKLETVCDLIKTT